MYTEETTETFYLQSLKVYTRFLKTLHWFLQMLFDFIVFILHKISVIELVSVTKDVKIISIYLK